MTWTATGGGSNLREDMLRPVRDREIILYPDKGKYESWLNKAMEFNDKGYKITVDTIVENYDCEENTDILDLILENKSNGPKQK